MCSLSNLALIPILLRSRYFTTFSFVNPATAGPIDLLSIVNPHQQCRNSTRTQLFPCVNQLEYLQFSFTQPPNLVHFPSPCREAFLLSSSLKHLRCWPPQYRLGERKWEVPFSNYQQLSTPWDALMGFFMLQLYPPYLQRKPAGIESFENPGCSLVLANPPSGGNPNGASHEPAYSTARARRWSALPLCQ